MATIGHNTGQPSFAIAPVAGTMGWVAGRARSAKGSAIAGTSLWRASGYGDDFHRPIGNHEQYFLTNGEYGQCAGEKFTLALGVCRRLACRLGGYHDKTGQEAGNPTPIGWFGWSTHSLRHGVVIGHGPKGNGLLPSQCDRRTRSLKQPRILDLGSDRGAGYMVDCFRPSYFYSDLDGCLHCFYWGSSGNGCGRHGRI